MVFTVTSSKNRGFTNSYLDEVEDKWKINLCTSFQPRSMFHFENTELPSFLSAWHQNRKVVSLKKVSPLDFQQFNHFKYYKMCLGARILALEWKERAFTEKMNSICFRWFPAAKLSTNMVSPYSVTDTESSIKVREMFRQITQKLWPTKTWDLDKLFIYKSFIMFHFLGFLQWTVSNLFFWAVFILAWRWKRRISLSMKRIVESRLNNSGRGKTERDVSKLCFL